MTEDTTRVQINPPIPYETEVYSIEPAGDQYPRNLYDVPTEQYQRWKDTWAAWEECEAEMGAILRDKTRQQLNGHEAVHDWRKNHGRPCCQDIYGWASHCLKDQP